MNYRHSKFIERNNAHKVVKKISELKALIITYNCPQVHKKKILSYLVFVEINANNLDAN